LDSNLGYDKKRTGAECLIQLLLGLFMGNIFKGQMKLIVIPDKIPIHAY
jgi:hypothetical protein